MEIKATTKGNVKKKILNLSAQKDRMNLKLRQKKNLEKRDFQPQVQQCSMGRTQYNHHETRILIEAHCQEKQTMHKDLGKEPSVVTHWHILQ